MQLEVVALNPVTCHHRKEINTLLAATSFQVVVKIDEVTPQPPFLQTKQPQFPQPLLMSYFLFPSSALLLSSAHS